MDLLSYKITKFVKEATVRSDMAKRIMHSLIPLVNENRIDHKALKYAVEGINDIIKYGTRACVEELEHYNKNIDYDYLDEDEIEDVYGMAYDFLKSNDYKSALEISYAAFSDDQGWHKAYGGYAWARIAKSLLNLVNLKSGLKATIENKDYQDELAVMKDIIIEMNIFDGLSHNTASVMRNIIEEEDKDLRINRVNHIMNKEDLKDIDLSKLHPNQIKKLKEKFNKDYYDVTQESSINHTKEKEKVFNMMDAKELSDPIDVYREIEQSLIESGDINKYKDYIGKLRNNPKYHNYDFNKIEEEKKLIKIRKTLLPFIKQFNVYNDLIDEDIDEDVDQHSSSDQQLYYKLTRLMHKIMDTGENLENRLNNELYRSVNKKLSLIKQVNTNRVNLKVLYDKLSNDAYENAGNSVEKINKKMNALLNAEKELKSIVYKFIFILESV